MTLQILDRVKETTAVIGLGPYGLLGAVVGFRAFTAVGNGNTCYYAAWDGGPNWEVGLGTYSIAGILTRTAILASSNGGAAVSWLSGIKTIWLDLPAVAIAGLSAGGTTQIITGTGPVTVAPGDGFILLNKASPSATTINLPTVASRGNLSLSIADWGGNAGDITIVPSGSETIMGLSTTTLISNGQGLGMAAAVTLRPSPDLAGWFPV